MWFWQTPVAVLAVALAAPTALAESFLPYKCPGSLLELPFAYKSHGSGGEHPTDPNCDPFWAGGCPSYIPNIDHHRHLLGNQWTKRIDLRFSQFDLEAGWDYFYLGQVGMGPWSTWTGVMPYGSWMTGSQAGGGYQQTPGRIRFVSDSIIGRKIGFNVDRLRMTCDGSPSYLYHTIEEATRYSGVMMESSDVIYAKFPAESSHHITVAMWGQADAGQDFDLYARCNALPTPTEYSQRAIWGQQEFLHLSPEECASPGFWYVAVNSYAGKGWFHLVKHTHRADQHRDVRVGANFNVTTSYPGGMSALGANFQKNVRSFFGLSEGTQYVENIHVYQNVGNVEIYENGVKVQDMCPSQACGGQDCDVCYQWPVTTYCCDPFNWYQVVLRGDSVFDDKDWVAHELAHHWMEQNDEYYAGGGDTSCGHTVMGAWGTDNGNLCVGDPTNPTQFSDHSLDRSAGNPADPSDPPGWFRAKEYGKTPNGWMPTSTPDNHNYRDFGFDDKMGRVFLH